MPREIPLSGRPGRLADLMEEDHRRLDEALADEIADGQLAWPEAR
jgi:hypothetical protein